MFRRNYCALTEIEIVSEPRRFLRISLLLAGHSYRLHQLSPRTIIHLSLIPLPLLDQFQLNSKAFYRIGADIFFLDISLLHLHPATWRLDLQLFLRRHNRLLH